LPLQAAPLPLLPLALRGGLTNQQLNVSHVVRSVSQDFDKPQLQEDFQAALHGADLMPGASGNGLRGVGEVISQ
jgi:hypothetical protein